MFATTLLTVTFILLGSVISSTSTAVVIQSAPITFRVSRRLNLSTNRNLLQHDQARAKALLARAENRVAGIQSDSSIIANEPVNNQVVIYVAAIGVGTPPTSCESCAVTVPVLNLWCPLAFR
jgi:cathepsin E